MILSIDPGSEQSAYVVLNNKYEILEFDKIDNDSIVEILFRLQSNYAVIIEMIASYGMYGKLWQLV